MDVDNLCFVNLKRLLFNKQDLQEKKELKNANYIFKIENDFCLIDKFDN